MDEFDRGDVSVEFNDAAADVPETEEYKDTGGEDTEAAGAGAVDLSDEFNEAASKGTDSPGEVVDLSDEFNEAAAEDPEDNDVPDNPQLELNPPPTPGM